MSPKASQAFRDAINLLERARKRPIPLDTSPGSAHAVAHRNRQDVKTALALLKVIEPYTWSAGGDEESVTP